MAEHNFKDNITEIFKGMNSVVSAKTVVGEPTQIGDTTIIPLVDVSFGMAVNNGATNSKNSALGGMGAKVTPSAILVIHDGNTRLISVKNQDNLTKILDMIPELVHRFTKSDKNEISDEEILETAFPEEE